MFGDTSARKRTKTLVTKATAHPVFPMLGWTKVAETVVAGGPTLNWVVYATLVTAVWVYADDVARRMDSVTDAVDDATDAVSDAVTDGGDPE